MTNQIRIAEFKTVLDHDRTNSKEVYKAIKTYYPDLSAKEFTTDMVSIFVNEDVDLDRWLVILKNTEYTASKPAKKKSKRRRSAGTVRRYSAAEEVVRRTTTDNLFK